MNGSSDHTKRFASVLWRASDRLLDPKFVDWIPERLIDNSAQKYSTVEDCLRDLEHLQKTLVGLDGRVDKTSTSLPYPLSVILDTDT